jgi:hypothetical protein
MLLAPADMAEKIHFPRKIPHSTISWPAFNEAHGGADREDRFCQSPPQCRARRGVAYTTPRTALIQVDLPPPDTKTIS